MTQQNKLLVFLLISVGLITSCSLAPRYKQPQMIIPNTFKEDGMWALAKPSYATADNPRWWEIYQDPILNQLEEKLIVANQDLKVALAQYEGALAALRIAKSAYYPTINGDAHATKQQISNNIANPSTDSRYNDYLLGSDLSYEIDLWGQVRNTVKASKNLARASRDDVAGVQLSLQATLASTYFSLRGSEASLRILEQLVDAYQKAYELTHYRYEGGIAAEMDVDLALTQLENVKTLAIDMKLKRAQYEHAIAVLIGQAPASFSLSGSQQQAPVVPIVAFVPSCLLERRPDIAAAERRVQAANATIGVARAAYFPNINLAGTTLGYESSTIGTLLNAPSLYWSFGPTASTLIFDGGKIAGQLAQAKASYHAAVASYRQTVLNALQEVEDNLAAQRKLEQESITQAAATAAANRAVAQAKYRYAGGIATYLDVAIEQNTALTADLALIDIHTRRQLASVMLVKALGGGWGT